MALIYILPSPQDLDKKKKIESFKYLLSNYKANCEAKSYSVWFPVEVMILFGSIIQIAITVIIFRPFMGKTLKAFLPEDIKLVKLHMYVFGRWLFIVTYFVCSRLFHRH